MFRHGVLNEGAFDWLIQFEVIIGRALLIYREDTEVSFIVPELLLVEAFSALEVAHELASSLGLQLLTHEDGFIG